MLTETEVWDELDEYVRTVSPHDMRSTDWPNRLTEMLAELHEIEYDAMPELRRYVVNWLLKG
jgi:hypothetical protein